MLQLSTKTILVFEDENGNEFTFDFQTPNLNDLEDSLRSELCLKAGVAFGRAMQAVTEVNSLLKGK